MNQKSKKNTQPGSMSKTTRMLAITILVLLCVLVIYAVWKPDQFEHLNHADVFRSSASFMVGLVLSTTSLSITLAFRKEDEKIQEHLMWMFEMSCYCILFALLIFILSLMPSIISGNAFIILFFAFAMITFYLIEFCTFINKIRKNFDSNKSKTRKL